VDDAEDFDPVLNGSIENRVTPHREMPERRDVMLSVFTDSRMLRVEFAPLEKLSPEAVRRLDALTVQIIEDLLQVFLCLVCSQNTRTTVLKTGVSAALTSQRPRNLNTVAVPSG
jgi:hypothetical protein